MEAGRELDAVIEEAIFGRPPSYYHCPHFDEKGRMLAFCSCPDMPNRSTRIEDAWPLFAKLKTQGWYSRIEELVIGGWWVFFHRGKETVSVIADTAPLGICLAALKAQGVDVEAG